MTRRLALASCLAAALALSGCGAAPGGPWTPSVRDVRINVELRDDMQFDPSSFVVPAGTAVTFVVKNVGQLPHEFVIGDEALQAFHEEQMAGAAAMAHDHWNGVGVDPGATKELLYTFSRAGETLAGCHVPGHYAAGMKAVIKVE